MKSSRKHQIFNDICLLFKVSKRMWHFSLLIIIVEIFLLPNTAYLATINSEKLITLTNQEREILHLSPLTANQLLTKAAYDKAQGILRSQRFEHNINGRRFSSWIRNAGYDYKIVGENLAIDFIDNESIISAWKNSSTHYQNIINPQYSEIGIATLDGVFENKHTTVVVQIFGAPGQNISMLSANNSPADFDLHANNNIAYVLKTGYAPENLLTDVSQKYIPETKLNIYTPSLSENIFNAANYEQVNKLFIRFSSLPDSYLSESFLGSLLKKYFPGIFSQQINILSCGLSLIILACLQIIFWHKLLEKSRPSLSHVS